MVYGGETTKAFAGWAGRRIRLVEEISISSGARSRSRPRQRLLRAVGDVVPEGQDPHQRILEGVGFEHETIRHMEPAQGGRLHQPHGRRAEAARAVPRHRGWRSASSARRRSVAKSVVVTACRSPWSAS